ERNFEGRFRGAGRALAESDSHGAALDTGDLRTILAARAIEHDERRAFPHSQDACDVICASRRECGFEPLVERTGAEDSVESHTIQKAFRRAECRRSGVGKTKEDGSCVSRRRSSSLVPYAWHDGSNERRCTYGRYGEGIAGGRALRGVAQSRRASSRVHTRSHPRTWNQLASRRVWRQLDRSVVHEYLTERCASV